MSQSLAERTSITLTSDFGLFQPYKSIVTYTIFQTFDMTYMNIELCIWEKKLKLAKKTIANCLFAYLQILEDNIFSLCIGVGDYKNDKPIKPNKNRLVNQKQNLA